MTLKHSFSGAAMLSAVRLLRLLAQFVTVPILSRLLAPHEYGLMAIAMPFALFAMMIADAGVGMSLVRTPLTNTRVWSTGFWLTVGLGIVLALAMAAAGPLATYIFHEPLLTPMLITLAFVVLAQAIHLIPVSALQQAERFRTIASIDIAATAVSLASAIVAALNGWGVWSLVAQQVSYFSVRVLYTCIASPFRPTLHFTLKETHEHIHFGRNVLASNLLVYCARQMDNWIVGKVLATTALGFYSMAFQFARLPAQLVSGPLNYVMYSKLTQAKGDTPALRHVLATTTRLVSLTILPVMSLVAAAHEPIFALLLSEKWKMAGVVFMILAPATALQAVGTATETVLYALNRTDIQLRRTLEYSLLWPAVLLLTVHHGLIAAAFAYTGCTLLYHFRYCALALKHLDFRPRDYIRLHIPALILSLIATLLYQLLSPAMGDLGRVLLSAALAMGALAAGFLYERRNLRHTLPIGT